MADAFRSFDLDINKQYDLIATAAFGLESVVMRELKWLGIEDALCENGRVRFKGTIKDVVKCNLWLRCSDRVLIEAARFPAKTFTELFDNTQAIDWQDILPYGCEFPVEGKSVKSILHSVPDCQKIVKKAICEKLKRFYHIDGMISETGPLFKLEISMLDDMATITIDTSGAGLNKRGYRKLTGPAPIKETLAAGMILVSRWNPERALMDPFCGTGTIPIEAAMIGLNIAPGSNREFISESWHPEIKKLYDFYRNEAINSVKKDVSLKIYASDINYESIKLALEHAKEAGVDDKINFQKIDFRQTSSKAKYGFIITNPPYGVRLGEKKQVNKLYEDMGVHFAQFDTWSYYIITPEEGFEKLFGRRADKKRKLYNGTIKCEYYQFWGLKPPVN
jgi:putative N6-adenine-specific DNA methylase